MQHEEVRKALDLLKAGEIRRKGLAGAHRGGAPTKFAGDGLISVNAGLNV